MKYVLIKNKKRKSKARPVLVGPFLVIKNKKQTLNIYSQPLIDKLSLREINHDLEPLLRQILLYLASDEDDETQTGRYYDLLAKQRSNILNNYEKKLSKAAVEAYMQKIRFVAFELKKRLMSYQYQKESLKIK